MLTSGNGELVGKHDYNGDRRQGPQLGHFVVPERNAGCPGRMRAQENVRLTGTWKVDASADIEGRTTCALEMVGPSPVFLTMPFCHARAVPAGMQDAASLDCAGHGSPKPNLLLMDERALGAPRRDDPRQRSIDS